MHDEPYVQYGARAVEPPAGARQEWRIFVDLAIAMRRPLFGAKGLNGLIKTTRKLARLTRKPSLEFGPHWIDRLVLATGRKVNGRRIKWRDVLAHPHGWVLGPREFGHFKDALRTDDRKVHAAPPEFVERARELLAEPGPEAPVDYPFQLANRRNRHSMNSWLNELPGLHPSGKHNEVVIHPDDAAALGISEGDRVKVSSPVGAIELAASVNAGPRRGVVVIDHGWGSRIFDPRGGSQPESYGANRNLLIDGGPVDPLSQTAALSSSYVAVERL
jgi:formate dehydrogenase